MTNDDLEKITGNIELGEFLGVREALDVMERFAQKHLSEYPAIVDEILVMRRRVGVVESAAILQRDSGE